MDAITNVETERPVVVARKRFREGPIVSVRIPYGAVECPLTVGDRKILAMSFLIGCKGGYVIFYAHPSTPRKLNGLHLTGRAHIFAETISDGRTFLTVHLVESPEKAMHKMRIVPSEALPKYAEDCHVIVGLPQPLQGAIVFSEMHKQEDVPRRNCTQTKSSSAVRQKSTRKPKPKYREKTRPSHAVSRDVLDIFRGSQHFYRRFQT